MEYPRNPRPRTRTRLPSVYAARGYSGSLDRPQTLASQYGRAVLVHRRREYGRRSTTGTRTFAYLYIDTRPVSAARRLKLRGHATLLYARPRVDSRLNKLKYEWGKNVILLQNHITTNDDDRYTLRCCWLTARDTFTPPSIKLPPRGPAKVQQI